MARKKITFYVSEEMDEWLQFAADAQDKTKSQLISDILEDVKYAFDQDEEEALAQQIYDLTPWDLIDEN